MMHLESGKLSPASGAAFMAAVEATFSAAGRCRSTSPYPTPITNMMAGAHNHAQR